MNNNHGFGYQGIFFSILISIASLIPNIALADGEVITLDTAYQMAFKNHEKIKIAEENLMQARAGMDKARSLLLPTVTAEGNYRRYTRQQRVSGFLLQPEDTTSFDLRVNQPLYKGGKTWSARRQARLILRQNRLDKSASRELVMLDTAMAYFNVLKAEKDIEIKEAALKRAKERKRVASSRYRVGEVTKTVVLRAEAELAGAEADLTGARARMIDARDLLKRLIGSRDDIQVVEPPMQHVRGDDIDNLIKRAYRLRRDYKESEISERIASEGVKYAKGSFLPTLSLEGVYTKRDQSPSTSFLLKEAVSGVLVLKYSFFEGGLRKAELSEARSKLREAELYRLGLKRDIELQVRSAFNRTKTLNTIINSYKKKVAFAKENYNMVFKQFKYGLATSVDVIDADTTLISAQRGLMSAKYDLQIAILELKYRTGMLLDEYEGGEK